VSPLPTAIHDVIEFARCINIINSAIPNLQCAGVKINVIYLTVVLYTKYLCLVINGDRRESSLDRPNISDAKAILNNYSLNFCRKVALVSRYLIWS